MDKLKVYVVRWYIPYEGESLMQIFKEPSVAIEFVKSILVEFPDFKEVKNEDHLFCIRDSWKTEYTVTEINVK